MEEMGMTEKQFSSALAFLMAAVEEKRKACETEEAKEKLGEVIELIQTEIAKNEEQGRGASPAFCDVLPMLPGRKPGSIHRRSRHMNHPDLQLEVTMERTADLVPYANNAKVHTDEQINQICTSIEEFGFADPVGVWTNADGESEIVEGHGRVLAAQKLGIEDVPVIHLDALTDEQRRAYMLAHNQLTMSTGWDALDLISELEGLAVEFDMEDFGFADYMIFEVRDDPQESATSITSESYELPGTEFLRCPCCGKPFELQLARDFTKQKPVSIEELGEE